MLIFIYRQEIERNRDQKFYMNAEIQNLNYTSASFILSKGKFECSPPNFE